MGRTARWFPAVLSVVGFAFGAMAGSASAVSFQVMSGNGSVGGTDSQVTYNDASQPSSPTGAAFIVTPNSAWISPIGSSLWISSAANTYTAGNPSFQTSFTLPNNAGSPSVSVSWYADNQATVSVNGGPPLGTPLETGDCPQDFVSGTEQTVSSSGLQGGANTMLFNTSNCTPPYGDFGSNPSGLDFVATVTYTPEPIAEDQCEDDGWQNLVDSNGDPFTSNLQCQETAIGVTTGSLPHGGQCNGIAILTNVKGDITVPPGGVCALSSSVTVSHDVTVQKGGRLYSSATIDHDLRAQSPDLIDLDKDSVVGHDINIDGLKAGDDNEICGTSVGHDLVFQNGLASAGVMMIGCPSEGGGDSIGHDLVVQNNAGAVTVEDNSAGHEARCEHNRDTSGDGNTPAQSSCNTGGGGNDDS